MQNRTHLPQVGAPDPELQNSPVIEDTDEEFEVIAQETLESAICHFNGTAYLLDQFVCSGSELLRCTVDGWLREGSCDPDNPD